MSEIENVVVDNFSEHWSHVEYQDNCSDCYRCKSQGKRTIANVMQRALGYVVKQKGRKLQKIHHSNKCEFSDHNYTLRDVVIFR